MRGLVELVHSNNLSDARFFRDRYVKLRRRAILRHDWQRARRYDRQVTDLERYIAGEIPVFPNRTNLRKGLYTPSRGRSFKDINHAPNLEGG